MLDAAPRPAVPADRAPVLALAGAAFGAYGDYAAILADWLEEPATRLFVVGEPGQPQGFVAIAWIRRVPGGAPDGDVLAMGVDPAARGLGLGRRLLDHAVSVLAAEAPLVGGVRATLAVADDNAIGRRLFASAGFLPLPERATYPGGQAGLLLYRPFANDPTLQECS
ncbi:MAG: GNAT family N-acetyltransferase [Myxococcales bacterium]|nr:GNAT family N-acetyltransferase [Myxococcales bacterium]